MDHGQGLLRAFDLFTDLAKILIKFKIRMKAVPLKGIELALSHHFFSSKVR